MIRLVGLAPRDDRPNDRPKQESAVAGTRRRSPCVLFCNPFYSRTLTDKGAVCRRLSPRMVMGQIGLKISRTARSLRVRSPLPASTYAVSSVPKIGQTDQTTDQSSPLGGPKAWYRKHPEFRGRRGTAARGERLRAIRHLYGAGLSLADIGGVLDLSRQSVWRLMRQAGIARRPSPREIAAYRRERAELPR